MMAGALNNISAIMQPDNNMHVRICGKYMAPCFAMVRPVDYRQTNALLCDLTFWAVEFLWLAEGT